MIKMPETYITTSWDDGHPLDLRVAELLSKHGLSGTFYVPMKAENGTMAAAQIRELSCAFEIGGHTVNHTVLTSTTEQQAKDEIFNSRHWLEDVTGQSCTMFCPPKGKYLGKHVEMVRRAGFIGLRHAELGSLDFPRPCRGIMLLPTTIQAYSHGHLAFARNAIKRAAFESLWRFVAHGRSTDWPTLAASLLQRALKCGGVFHLWGHSWELEGTGQWQRLDAVLRFMAACKGDAPTYTNGQICLRPRSQVLSSQLGWRDRLSWGK
ncbi:MAG: polysaccharide deacetylase family protein [Hyphomicrobiales bacterium]|nr:polysaccharide deacetylase family protein [Hyphomicrobiales bacterium]